MGRDGVRGGGVKGEWPAGGYGACCVLKHEGVEWGWSGGRGVPGRI